MFASHYSSTYNFTFDGIKASRKARLRIQEFIYSLMSEKSGDNKEDVDELQNNVFGFLADDLHTPKALAEVFTFINKTDANTLDLESKKSLLAFFEKLNNVFAVWNFDLALNDEKAEVPQEIIELAQKRLEAKMAKKLC